MHRLLKNPLGPIVATMLLYSGASRSDDSVPPVHRQSYVAENAKKGASVAPIITTHNKGPEAAVGEVHQYFSSAFKPGFDVGTEWTAIFDPDHSDQSKISTSLAQWFLLETPNDPSNLVKVWGSNIIEFNIVNRGPDDGWHRDRTGHHPTGGLLMVPETKTFGQPGEGKNATYAYSLSHSGSPNSTGLPAKWYNGYICEPDSIVGKTGRCLYLTGDITGDASQMPFAPIQFDGAWLHGLDTSRASILDGAALHGRIGQGIRFGDGKNSVELLSTGSATVPSMVLHAPPQGNIMLDAPLQLASFLATALPPANRGGREVFCSDCRTPGEGPNKGTGMIVFDNGHGQWDTLLGSSASH
jgi:hypothetical protein